VISVIKTDSGKYNVIGTNDDGFNVQGCLTKDELKELVVKGNQALKSKSK